MGCTIGLRVSGFGFGNFGFLAKEVRIFQEALGLQ